MIKILCYVEPEDYWTLDSTGKSNVPVNYYGYTFEVKGGGGETSGGFSSARVSVIEFSNLRMAMGLALPEGIKLDGEFELRFICHERMEGDIPVVCKLSKEVKSASYKGDDEEKLEFIGFTLERFYEGKNARFYFYDLRKAKIADPK
ncbi:MAG: hypothetical protein ACT4NX_08830 [Deltaproteobacteria bacterium]